MDPLNAANPSPAKMQHPNAAQPVQEKEVSAVLCFRTRTGLSIEIKMTDMPSARGCVNSCFVKRQRAPTRCLLARDAKMHDLTRGVHGLSLTTFQSQQKCFVDFFTISCDQ